MSEASLPHQALLLGLAHLSPGRGGLRLEARGLLARRVQARPGLPRPATPGLYRVALWPRTDSEGFATRVILAGHTLREEAPIGTVPEAPLTFRLRGLWLGVHEGVARILIVPKDPLETPPFVVRFLHRGEAPDLPPRATVAAEGGVERGRLIGAVLG